jgi:hypothetical protein
MTSRSERLRDFPWSAFTATVMVEVYCPDYGVKREKVLLLPTKAPFSQRFEEAVGLACEMASARQVARPFQLPASTVRAWCIGARTGSMRRKKNDGHAIDRIVKP